MGRAGRVALVSVCPPPTAPSVVGPCESRDLATTLLFVQVSPPSSPPLPPCCARPALSWTLPHPYKTHLTPHPQALSKRVAPGMISTLTLQKGLCLQFRLIPTLITDFMVFSGSPTCRQAGRLLNLESNIIKGQWISIDDSSKAKQQSNL